MITRREVRVTEELESWRRVDPKEDGFAVAGIEPAMAAGAFEPEAFAFVEDVALEFVEPDFESAVEHVDEFFAVVGIGAVASGAWGHAKQHGLKHFCAGGEEFHGDAGFGA